MKNTTKTHDENLNLEKRVSELEKQNAEYIAKIKWYEEQFRLFQKKAYGPSSEKSPDNQMELPLFNEAEITSDLEVEEPDEEEITYVRKKNRKRTSEDSVDRLPVEVVTHELPEDEQVCDCCEQPVHEMNVEIRREIEIAPAEAFVREHRRSVYACRNCEKNEVETPIKRADSPEPVIHKSMASPSSVSHILTQKYVEGMPLYRQEQQLSRLGLNLSRQTMANWAIKAAEAWLEPMYVAMKLELLKASEIHADETTVQVLSEKGREGSNNCFMWLYRSGRLTDPITLFDFQSTRAAKHPRKFLDGYSGTVHVDGYQGYESIPKVTLSGCMAHARRKFDEAAKASKPSEDGKLTLAQEGLKRINEIYKIERTLKDKSPEEILEIRQNSSLKLVEDLFAWAKIKQRDVLPKSKLGLALKYIVNQQEKLKVPFYDGRLDIDNNKAERSIKPFVIGRKNWLFSNSVKGARTSATIYSIIETAKENNLKPFDYLNYLFTELPKLKELTPETLAPHMPYSDQLPSNIKTPK